MVPRSVLNWHLHPAFLPVRPQNLVGWWNSSSHIGTTWRNLAPNFANANHGTLREGVAIGELLHPSGRLGLGLKFDGSDDDIDCGNDSSVNITADISIDLWLKFNEIKTAGIVAKGIATKSFYIHTVDDGTIRWYISSDGSDKSYRTTINTFTSLTDWYHIATVFVPSTTQDIYVNGIKQSCSASGAIRSSIHVSSDPLLFGQMFDGFHFHGTIAEVRIYNHALSADEIMHNYTHSPLYYMLHGVDPLSLL